MAGFNLENRLETLKGDKVLWIVIILISAFSVFPVYSASSNLEYIVNTGTTTGHVVKHMFFVVLGLVLMRSIGFVRYEHIGKLSTLLLILSMVLLILTMMTGQTIDGASASGWVKRPGTSLSFQPSSFAYLMLIIHLCRYLTKKINRDRLLLENVAYIFLPIAAVFVLVARDNGSTALMILLVSLAVLVIGQLNWKYIAGFVSSALIMVVLFVTIALTTDWMGGSRVHTWKSRIEVFFNAKDEASGLSSEELKTKNYQVMQAKAAIVHGGITGMGPGKSALKQMLPQSASDFIFAIIIEEYGFVGAFALITLYLIMIIRIVIIASKMPAFFGSLLVIAIGLMIFVQIAVNIAVAVNLIPVTGQPLPLISYGGTSMLVTYLQLGIILNVSSRIQLYDEEGIGKKQSIEQINDIA